MSSKTKSLTITVEFNVIVPATMKKSEIEGLIIEMDVSSMDLYGADGEEVEGAEIRANTTVDVKEDAP